jgi:Winged helix domain, variant/ATPase family associated with various cellular activities (AAA)
LIDAAKTEQGSEHTVPGMSEEAECLHIESAARLAKYAPWSSLVEYFALDRFEQDVLLLAFAPELQLKYETLYAYLNNDVTRKFPTIDLALRLFSDQADGNPRAALSPAGRLFAERLLEIRPGDDMRHSLHTGFVIAPAVADLLLQQPPVDPHLVHLVQQDSAIKPDWERMLFAAAVVPQLKALARMHRHGITAPPVVLEGETGSGRREAARAILGGAEKDMLSADLTTLTVHDQPLVTQIDRLLLQARLADAGVLLRGLDQVMNRESKERAAITALLPRLAISAVPLFFSVEENTPWRTWFQGWRITSIRLTAPSFAERQQLWQNTLSTNRLQATSRNIAAVSDRFRLNCGQIRTAFEAITLQRQLHPNGSDPVTKTVLFAAAREQSLGEIGQLAQRVETEYATDDLVLPPTTRQRITEIVAAIDSRRIVYQQWGMQRRVGGATGLMVLFAGASGTGKTMTASVIAQEIGLPLYRIDLAAVVSKYIGETEKISIAFSTRRTAPIACCFLMKPMPCSANARKSKTPMTAMPTSKSPICCKRWKTMTARWSSQQISPRTSTPPFPAECTTSPNFPGPTPTIASGFGAVCSRRKPPSPTTSISRFLLDSSTTPAAISKRSRWMPQCLPPIKPNRPSTWQRSSKRCHGR